MIKVLAAEPRSKKRSGDEAFVFLAAPPPNLPRPVHNTASYAGYIRVYLSHLHAGNFYFLPLRKNNSAALFIVYFSEANNLGAFTGAL